MNPPLVKTTRTAPVSACDGVAKATADSRIAATPTNRIRCFLMCAFSSALISVRGRTGLIQGNHHGADVRGKFKTHPGALQRDDHPFVVLELHAPGADDRVSSGKITQLVDVVGASDKLADGGAGSEADAHALNGEGIVAMAKGQNAAPSAGAEAQACLDNSKANGTADRMRRRRQADR